MSYLKLTVSNTSELINEIIIAHLAEHSFNGFEDQENELVAYIAQQDYSEIVMAALDQITSEHNLTYQKEILEDQNWNAQWESDYQPVLVDDFCAVRATFHPPINNVKHEIVITPKMSFGTGHHATTYMMMKQMETIDFSDKKVFDYGCGTGVLAILAALLGAKDIDAVDIETWAYNNTVENVQINETKAVANIAIYCGEITAVPTQQYDIVLANINRNVILNTMSEMAARLKPNGYLLTSGFLEQDIALVSAKAKEFGLEVHRLLNREKWRCILFSKS